MQLTCPPISPDNAMQCRQARVWFSISSHMMSDRGDSLEPVSLVELNMGSLVIRGHTHANAPHYVIPVALWICSFSMRPRMSPGFMHADVAGIDHHGHGRTTWVACASARLQDVSSFLKKHDALLIELIASSCTIPVHRST